MPACVRESVCVYVCVSVDAICDSMREGVCMCVGVCVILCKCDAMYV